MSYTTGVPAMIGSCAGGDRQVGTVSGVFNIEELDPDPFMDMLNADGLAVAGRRNLAAPVDF